MHIYSSILDPYEPPRPARNYDNPPVVRRSLLSQLFAGFRRAAVTPLTISTAGRPGAGANRRARSVERGDLAGREGGPLCDRAPFGELYCQCNPRGLTRARPR